MFTCSAIFALLSAAFLASSSSAAILAASSSVAACGACGAGEFDNSRLLLFSTASSARTLRKFLPVVLRSSSAAFNSFFALISLEAPTTVSAIPATKKGMAYIKPTPALDIPAHDAANTTLPSVKSLAPFAYISLLFNTVFTLLYISSVLVER